MKTYPYLNEKIVEILRLSDNPACLYAAQRIEDLELVMREIADIVKESSKDPDNIIWCQNALKKIENLSMY